ncbi:MAG: bifunctional proline dehydrogenase/L-glutamate gamma-semialdehyde dehydrogenase PutA [Hyphomicrobiales bacterium]
MLQSAVKMKLPGPALPPRGAIAEKLMADECAVVEKLLPKARLDGTAKDQVEALASRLVHAVRANRHQAGGIDSFMREYSLSSEEGVVLMCLAEALLRVPDAATADRLIADKIGGGQWAEHFGRSESLFVNASTWGLMLTGRVINLGDEASKNTAGYFRRMVARSGEPFIRQALRHAMRVMGRQFVLGRNIDEALQTAARGEKAGYRYSYDMLGEAAMTDADARAYMSAYVNAIEAIADKAGAIRPDRSLHERPGLSVKLSAIHCRYEPKNRRVLDTELYKRVLTLCAMARERDLGVTIDAEEAFRLDLSLGLFARLAGEGALAGWEGPGLAVQAYSKRGLAVLEWLAELAAITGRRVPVRLVKGAYWDSEIKAAQEAGLDSYPVFTRKVLTDVSYLACARFMLSRPNTFYSQFATHNAHTLAAIMVMAGSNRDFEFQRLHGMGQALYDEIAGDDRFGGIPCRVYAPVGTHEDLLAYLVRRLLENGANTSFVHRIANDKAPISEVIADPVERAEQLTDIPHPQIPLPGDIFAPRKNARGFALWEDTVREPFLEDVRAALKRKVTATALVGGEAMGGPSHRVVSPHDNRVEVGIVAEADDEAIERALAKAHAAQHDWDLLGGRERAQILERAAELYESNMAQLVALMVREAGKTLENAVGDLREAVDFLRYYAARARETFSAPVIMPGPTGERNEMRLHGRGVFVCISPWNFPLAIFTGQVAAALAAGNTVITKPAEQTPLAAVEAVKLLHKAGVPGDCLHVLPGEGARVGGRLIADARCSGVAFTGSNATAAIINKTLSSRDGAIIPLIAETGGINAMIVDSTALPEQALRDLVDSVFDSAGQRCSAARVLFVQDDIANRVIDMLKGRLETLTIGDPLDYATDIGPVIDRDALETLQAHKARMAREAKALIDLPLGEETHHGTFVAPAAYEIEALSALKGEVFGPVLHVIRYGADRLDAVFEAINATGYGLTLGLHTRIKRRAEEVRRRVRVGNLYVNRNQIGAVVGAQPFGGEGLSGTGPKAGGPNYLYRFACERVVSIDTTASGGNASLLAALS